MNKKSLAETHPEIAKLWSCELNGELKADMVTAGSNKEVYWVCSISGGIYSRKISNQVRSKGVSPYVSGSKVLKGFNDLSTTHESIAKNWNYELNELTPDMVSFGSHKEVWWNCPKTNKNYLRSVKEQVRHKGNSPFIDNSLLNTHREICKQWNYELNELTPDIVTAGSGKKIYWICPESKGSYLRSISDQVKWNGRSPYVSGKRALKGFNDLSTTHESIAKNWNYELNELTPDMVTCESAKEVYWLCSKSGGTYLRTVVDEVKSGGMSPFVSNKRVLKGFNDLSFTHPELTKQWNYSKNDGLLPEMFTYGSEKVVWWICLESGGEWQVSINNRTSKNSSLSSPFVLGKKIKVGYNDLKTTHYDLSKQWNYEKNKDLFPENFTAGTHKKVWWVCEKGHEWKSAIYSRTAPNNPTGCPKCSASISKKEQDLYNFICSIIPTPIRIITNDRKILSSNRGKIGGTEIDILIPALNLGFEFNGHYWHEEGVMKPIGYHDAKTKAAFEQGVQLIHVWEDNWNINCEFEKSIVLSHIESRLSLID